MKAVAAALALVLSAILSDGVQACTRFPLDFLVSHKKLVARTPRIALVEVLGIELDDASYVSKISFKPVEALKGDFPDTLELRHAGWAFSSKEKPHYIEAPERAFSDFDRHRDPGFWNPPPQYMGVGRSLGVGTDCRLQFIFEPGSQYLGFFNECCGRRPQHVHAFELILHDDDAWLKKVRELVAK